MTVLRLGVINIPQKVGRRAWRVCFRRVAQRASIFGINESFGPRQRRTYRRMADRLGYGHYGTGSPNPIFWDRERYRLHKGRVIRLHPAGTSKLASRYPGYNAARFVTEAMLEPLDGGRGITVLNTHWVPRGPKVPAWWRAWARLRSKRRIRRLVRVHRRAGRVVVLMGDLNIAESFHVVNGFTWLRSHGVDKIGVTCPQGARLGWRRAFRFAAPTDHKHGIFARAEIKEMRPTS